MQYPRQHVAHRSRVRPATSVTIHLNLGLRAVIARCRHLALLLVALVIVPASSLVQSAAVGVNAQGVLASPVDYWHTSGNRIVEEHGRPVRIAAVNWFGMENLYF